MFANSPAAAPNTCRPCVGRAASVALALALVLAGCSSDDDPPVAVPSSPPLSAPPGSGSPSTQSPTSPRDQVIAAYRGYWQAGRQAALVPIAQARKVLEPYSTSELVERQLTGIRQLQAKKQEPWGQVSIRVAAVEVTGATARLSDCQDVSGAGLADARTHQLIPGTRGGSKPAHLSVTLRHGQGARWRVSAIRPVEAPCTPPPSSGA